MSSFKGVDYDRPYEILSGIDARFVDAGHILGSASIELEFTEGDAAPLRVLDGSPSHDVNRLASVYSDVIGH